MANGICFDGHASHHTVVDLLVLGATLVLPIAQVCIAVINARCDKCSSRISTAKAALQELQLADC